MNEKRNVAEAENEPGSTETRSQSDVAPRQKIESGVAPRRDSGFRSQVHIPKPPPIDLTPEDLVEEGWEHPADDDSSDSTLLDSAAVPAELVAQARAVSDPIGELDEPDDEFDHDDFPTRETPMALEEALRAVISDDARGLHETLPPQAPQEPRHAQHAQEEIAPSGPVAPSSVSPDATARMIIAPTPAPPPARTPAPPPASPPSQPSQSTYPTPSSMMTPSSAPRTASGTPMLPVSAARNAFLSSLTPGDPPLHRLAAVALISFFGTLALAGLVALSIYLLRH